MTDDQKMANRILMEYITKYYKECASRRIDKGEPTRALMTLANSVVLSESDESHTIDESLEKVMVNLRTFAKEINLQRLKSKVKNIRD